MPVTIVGRVTGDILISQTGGFNIQYVACDERPTFRYNDAKIVNVFTTAKF